MCEIQGDIHDTNPKHYKDGCSNCVAADYMEFDVDEFNALYQYKMIARDADVVNDMFTALKIASIDTVEFFDNRAAFMKAVQETDGDYEVALGWGMTEKAQGHIIRGTINDGAVTLWNPQGIIGKFPLPDVKFSMWTLI